MAESEVTLKVKVDSKQAEKQVESLSKSFSDSFGSGIKKAESGFSSFFSTSNVGLINLAKGFGLATVAIGAAAFAIREAFSAAEDIAKIADETNKINKQFDFLAEKSGDTGGKLRQSFEDVNQGILDTEDILKSASVALTNLSIPTQDIAKNFEAARKTAIALGGDTLQNFEAINTAIASGNTRVLKQIGLFIDANDAVAQYANKIGLASKFLTDAQKEAALFEAIQNKVNSSFANVDVSTKTVSESFQQFGTAAKDLGEAVSIALTKIFGPSVSALLTKFSESLGTLSNEILKRFGSEAEQAAAKQKSFNDRLDEEIEKLNELKAIQSAQVGASLSGINSRVAAQDKLVLKLQQQQEQEDILKMKQQQAIDFQKKNSQEQIVLTEQQKLKLQELEAARLASFQRVEELEAANVAIKLQRAETDLEFDALFAQRKIDIEQAAQFQIDTLRKQFADQGIANSQRFSDAEKAIREKSLLEIQAIEKQRADKKNAEDEKRRAKELQDQQAFFGAATSLANAKSKELVTIGKAAAIAEIAIKTPQAVASSFAFGTSFGGPVVGFILAAVAAAAMAVQAANVAGAGLATGLTSVPKGFPNDTFPANLTSGERVVNVEQNRDLTSFLDNQDEAKQETSSPDSERTNGLLEIIASRLGALENTIVVNVGNREIMREVRDGIRSGQQVIA